MPDSCKCLRVPVKLREMDWQLVASYFTVKFTDSFYSVDLRNALSLSFSRNFGLGFFKLVLFAENGFLSLALLSYIH